jgi:hypothetical protein
VHPGHSKAWGGNITEPMSLTTYRFESAATIGKRLGLVRTESGGFGYAPMMADPRDVEADFEAKASAGVSDE